MDKVIRERIEKLNTDEEIYEFVYSRIKELEETTEEKTVGQEYTDSFTDFISSKIHYKPVARYKGKDTADLVYDDYTPYIEVIRKIRNVMYNELYVFSDIFYCINNYLPNDDMLGITRGTIYALSGKDRVSIKEIRENKCALCSEKAGLAHNIFKILGIDSKWVSGYRDSEPHAFNIIYPNGYENGPMILFDPSHFVSFKNQNNKYSVGYFVAMAEELYKKLENGNPYKVSLEKTESFYRQAFGLDSSYEFEGDEAEYIIGLENKKAKDGPYSQIREEDWIFKAQMENGLEPDNEKIIS